MRNKHENVEEMSVYTHMVKNMPNEALCCSGKECDNGKAVLYERTDISSTSPYSDS